MELKMILDQLKSKTPLDTFTIQQRALWHIHHNEWEEAHNLIQDLDDSLSCIIHAYIHKVEGDEWNAKYWYAKGGRRSNTMGKEEEFSFLVHKSLQ